MKKTIKLIEAMRGIAVIVLIMIAVIPVFAGGSRDKSVTAAEPSTLTITGLEKWNGMFIMVKTRGLNHEGIKAGGRIVERVSPFHGRTEKEVEGVRIANGRVSLTVWSNTFIEPEGVEVGDLFTGSEVKDNLEFIIWSCEAGVWEWSSRDNDIIKVFDEFKSLKFTKGSATFNGANLPTYNPNE